MILLLALHDLINITISLLSLLFLSDRLQSYLHPLLHLFSYQMKTLLEMLHQIKGTFDGKLSLISEKPMDQLQEHDSQSHGNDPTRNSDHSSRIQLMYIGNQDVLLLSQIIPFTFHYSFLSSIMGATICKFADIDQHELNKIPNFQPDFIKIPGLLPSVETVLSEQCANQPKFHLDFLQKEPLFRLKRLSTGIYLGQLSQVRFFLSESGNPEGLGKMYKNDQSFFIGHFQQGLAHGQGLYIFSDGSYFLGNFQKNEANTLAGVFSSNKGFHYKGGIKKNLFEGEGIESSQLHQFQGIYEKGKKVYGELTWTNPSKEQSFSYIGKFDSNEQFVDQAILKDPKGQYKGNFLNGKKHGKGVYFFKNNLTYEGEYEEGAKSGLGKVCFTDSGQLLFHGSFHNGLPEGKGEKIELDGRKVLVNFKDGINVSLLTES